MSRGMKISVTLLATLLGLWMLLAGSQKFLSSAPFEQMFADFGLPAWLVPIIGVLEIAGGVLLLIPRTAWIGASLVTIVMVGAVGSHLFSGVGSPIAAIVALAMAVFVAVVRRRAAPS